ncbi:MAG: hypothetical protein QE285_15740 [Aquabacterium sp.]|nr:hypothetical protein [Aquabacterium sp.]
MAIRYLKKHAALEGVVSAEEAEALAQWLQKNGTASKPAAVHLGKCEHLHSAALQVLLALRPSVSAPPADRWLAGVLGLEPAVAAPAAPATAA